MQIIGGYPPLPGQIVVVKMAATNVQQQTFSADFDW